MNYMMMVVIFIFGYVLHSLYRIYKVHIYKYLVLNRLSGIKYGEITLMDKNEKIIFKKTSELSSNNNAVIKINNEKDFFERVFYNGEVGLGEGYVNNVWTTPGMDSLTMLMMKNEPHLKSKYLTYHSYSSVKDDYKNIQHHYDLGNDFYETFLTDSLKAYSCGFFFNQSDTLDTAQYNKVNKILQKLDAKPHHHVLDMGCGWGRIGSYVQNKIGCKVHGITLSKEQLKHIESNYQNISAELKHYQEFDSQVMFDRIYSIGMFEHVRCTNYQEFFGKMYKILNQGGRFVLHSISKIDNDVSCNDSSSHSFVTKHIFPGGQIPKHEWIIDNAIKQGFKIIHIEVFGGMHYARTLREWKKNLLANKNKLLEKYSENDINMYEYYFSICEAAFLNNVFQLSQYVFDKVDDLSQVTHTAYPSNNDHMNINL